MRLWSRVLEEKRFVKGLGTTTTGVNHVKSMWRSYERRENFTCFFTWACVKNGVKSPCENQVKWDGPFHIMDDVKKLCEIRKFTSCIVRLGLMIWCEKLCETCFDWPVNMWNFSFTFFFTLSWSSQIRYTYLAGHIIYIYMHADHAHAHDLYAAYSFM